MGNGCNFLFIGNQWMLLELDKKFSSGKECQTRNRVRPIKLSSCTGSFFIGFCVRCFDSVALYSLNGGSISMDIKPNKELKTFRHCNLLKKQKVNKLIVYFF